MAKTQTSPETTLTLKRTFAAPRERVFRAWADPKELALWFAPSPDHKAIVVEMEFKVGGNYRLEIHHKGGNVHRLHGTYREIVPPEKIAFTWSWAEGPDANGSLVTVEFHDLGKSTEVALTHEGLPNMEEREKHNHGWNGVLEQFAQYL